MYKRTHNKIFHCPGQFPAIFYANPRLDFPLKSDCHENEISSLRFLFSVSSPEGHFQADRCRADALVALSFQAIGSKLPALK